MIKNHSIDWIYQNITIPFELIFGFLPYSIKFCVYNLYVLAKGGSMPAPENVSYLCLQIICFVIT